MVIERRTSKIEHLLAEVDLLVNLIKETELYQDFIKCLNQVEKHPKINEYINQIKRLQKQRVNANYLEKQEFVNKLNQDIDTLHQKLDSIPLYTAYQELKNEVEVMMRQISESLEDSINL